MSIEFNAVRNRAMVELICLSLSTDFSSRPSSTILSLVPSCLVSRNLFISSREDRHPGSISQAGLPANTRATGSIQPYTSLAPWALASMASPRECMLVTSLSTESRSARVPVLPLPRSWASTSTSARAVPNEFFTESRS
ncbi:Uncharacterised protein [Mycobacteroides abscessus subsp. abscessus]|nr:Uncharacterised protein [Mycobacteroides abscessus subsp. abscessus]